MACELWENVKRQSNVTLLCPATPAKLEMGTASALLTLTDGRTLAASLLVGADGRDSWVRNALGLRAHSHPVRMTKWGWSPISSARRPHRGIARQWFRRDGVLAWLPMAGDRISIVWSTPDENARALLALPAEELCSRVAAAGECELGPFTLLTPATAFPLRLVRVPQIVAPRLALLGDAAHGIHPLSGHGINLGYQDARTLAELLAATPDWQDIGSERLLKAYQRQRREETLLMQATTHALHHLFQQDFPGFRTLRNLGMNLTNALPVVKNMLVRYATGAF